MEVLQARLRDVLAELPRVEKEMRERLRELVRTETLAAVAHPITDLVGRYAALPAVVAHLEALRKDVVEHAGELLKPAEGAAGETPGVEGDDDLPGPGPFRRYRANLLVDHSESKGAPVVFLDHPSYANLLGRTEHVARFGALLTDFHLIRAGALHRANGGYLVLDALDVLGQPYAWEGLKRALRSREVRIESLGQLLSLASTVALEPEPVPLRVKVVLVGERRLYWLLDALDPEFPSLFKVAADFEEDVERTEETDLAFARLLAGIVRGDRLRPLDRTAVAAMVERSARWAGDVEKHTTAVGAVADLLREADREAGAAGRSVVGAADVARALATQERRDGRLRERVLEEIGRGTVLVDTKGSRVGQVNGLSVSERGHVTFGRPVRITARVRLGRGDVVDLERESELGGPVHSKGVMILAGFLGARYATDHPLSLSASLVFEQSYGPVEGDSASSAELYALLSALADVPIRQSLAVTGSVNQHGEVQAVGGVNEKVEGFFDLCRERGLAGDQGVLVPASNVRHLALRADVVEAVQRGVFRVIPIETVDQGIEALTGVPAGSRDAAGEFPAGSLNERVEARLVSLAERRATFAASISNGGSR
jgi:lon-related putative ATP-dependent protease